MEYFAMNKIRGHIRNYPDEPRRKYIISPANNIYFVYYLNLATVLFENNTSIIGIYQPMEKHCRNAMHAQIHCEIILTPSRTDSKYERDLMDCLGMFLT